MAHNGINVVEATTDYIWYIVYDDATKDLQTINLIEPGTTLVDNSKRNENLKHYNKKEKETFLDFMQQNKINIDNIEIPDELLDIDEKAYVKGKSVLSLVLSNKLKDNGKDSSNSK